MLKDTGIDLDFNLNELMAGFDATTWNAVDDEEHSEKLFRCRYSRY